MDGGLSSEALGARTVRRRGSADSDSTLTSLETVRTLPGGLSKYVSNKEAAVSWTTHLVPGDVVLECVRSPAPNHYNIHDPKAIGRPANVPFRGKNTKRELTQIDPTYKGILENPGPGAYDLAKSSLSGGGATKISEADRFYETYHIYKGAENAVNTDKDTPGPGAYELASSSFRGVNAFGPPHTFGATNHDQTYATDSPGPLAYNAVPPPKYSPQFGFGVSKRGEGNKTFPGEDFMMKGRMGPGPGAGKKAHYDLEVSGGVISASKRPANNTLKFACHSEEAKRERRRKAKEERARRKAEAEAAKGPDFDNLTPRTMKRLATSTDYSWLRAAENPSKSSKSTYVKSLDGCEKLAAKPFKHSPSTNFGGNDPRFNDFVYIPSVRSIRTESPGPKYKPVDPKEVGKGPSARFNTGPKMPMTPGEWSRRNNPGPGQYNLTEDSKIEAMALQAYEVLKLDQQFGDQLDASGSYANLRALTASGSRRRGMGSRASMAQSQRQSSQRRARTASDASRSPARKRLLRQATAQSIGAHLHGEGLIDTFVEETDDGEKSPEDAAREYVEQERARVLAAGSVYDAELVREFVVALSRRVGWSGRVMEQVVTKLRAVGLSKMEQVSLAFRFSSDTLGDAFDEDNGIDRAAEAKAAEEAKQAAEAAAKAKASADADGDAKAEAEAGTDADAKTEAVAKAAGAGADADAKSGDEAKDGDAKPAAKASGVTAGSSASKKPPISPVKRVRIVTDADTARAKAASPSTNAPGAGASSSADAADAGSGGKQDDGGSTTSASAGPKPLLINRLMRAKGFRPFSARTVAVAVAMMGNKEGKYFFVAPVLRSPISRKPVVKPKLQRGTSRVLLKAASERALNAPVAIRALTRSMSHAHTDPNANVGLGAPPPEPIIRPETAKVDTTALQNEFKRILRFPGGGNVKRVPSMTFIMGDRQKEKWKLYLGPGTPFMARDSPGPGTYELANSSFRPTNPRGKSTFGATNHDQDYETPSPGPLAYNAVPPPKYSPQFGFGAGDRGNRRYHGEQFMPKGQLGPGTATHSPLKIQGGVISTSRRPVCEPLPRPAPSPFEEYAMKQRKKEQARQRKLAKKRKKQAKRALLRMEAEREAAMARRAKKQGGR